MSLSSDAFFPFRDNIDRAAQVREVNDIRELNRRVTIDLSIYNILIH